MKKLYLDTETCGLHSFVVLLQYAVDDGPIHLYNVWNEPVGKTLDLIRSWVNDPELCVVGFNLVFDWFHICKLFTVWSLLPRDAIPIDNIENIACNLESKARDGECVKPHGAFDLLLHSRKGPFQSLMSRDDIRIRKVPAVLAPALAAELENRVELDGIYFAKSKDKNAPRWKVFDREDKDGNKCPHFKDVVLKFNPAGGLKFLAEHALGYEPKFHFADVEPKTRPIEFGWAPFARAVTKDPEWQVFEGDKLKGFAWPGLIREHADHWANNEQAREYARDDIVYTRALYDFFDRPPVNDDDSVLTCAVAAVRWHGFKINRERMSEVLADHVSKIETAPINTNKPTEVRAYLREAMTDVEYFGTQLDETTDKGTLEKIRDSWGDHPAAKRAAEVLDIKTAHKVVDAAKKLLIAGRMHAAFDVIGAKSNRMSGRGSGGLNPQGMKREAWFRSAFPLAWEGAQLCGGDFDSFELTLMDAVYNDPKLREVLSGDKKLHALAAMQLRPDLSYADVLATKDTDDDWYTKGKRSVFGRGYGSEAPGMARTLGIEEDAAERMIEWFNTFEGVSRNFQKIDRQFGCLVQPDGIGSRVVWREPREYVESFLGFRRWFTLEIRICRALFDLAQAPPKGWRNHPVKVVRRDRVQTAGGAVASALYGAAFGIAASMKRQAANHEIQSPGGQICKRCQVAIWDLQPAGVKPFHVAPMNVHDELMVATDPTAVDAVTAAVDAVVAFYQPKVPLIGMEWCDDMRNWAEKKSGDIKMPSAGAIEAVATAA